MKLPRVAWLGSFVVLACYDGPSDSGSGSEGPSEGGTPGSGDDDDTGDHPIPEVPSTCEGFEAQDISAPTATISGADCNETAIRSAVEAGGTIVLDCPGPVVFTAQMTIRTDTVIDGSGTTVLDGGGATRLLFKVPGPSLWLQNLTITGGQAPNANNNPELDPNHWADWPGGAVLAQCHDDSVSVGGAVYGKNFTCTDSATGESTRNPNDGSILDTGTGGCVYSFACMFHCDECTFTGNHATNGGAIGTLGGKIQLTRSTCADNEARIDSSSNDNQGFGGCFYQDGTETAPGEDELNYSTFCGNAFSDNDADVSGGAVQYFYRQHTHTSFEFRQNLCQGNTAGGGSVFAQGGCLYVYVDPTTKIPWAPDVGPDSFVVTANAFLDNGAVDLGGGAAIYNIWETAVRFDNNLFTGNHVDTTNQAMGGGGALGLVGTYFDLEQNTFARNVANNWNGGIILGAGGVALRNNLFFENSAPNTMGGAAVASEHVNYQLDEVDDGMGMGFLVYASGGNLYTPSTTPSGEPRPSPGAALLDVDPLLGELVSDDTFPPYLPLGSGSPAVDAGMLLDTVEVDIRGHDRGDPPDIGAYEQGG
jgi:hypothetical protein